MPETGAFKDDIKADSEVPTRAKKARKSGNVINLKAEDIYS